MPLRSAVGLFDRPSAFAEPGLCATLPLLMFGALFGRHLGQARRSAFGGALVITNFLRSFASALGALPFG